VLGYSSVDAGRKAFAIITTVGKTKFLSRLRNFEFVKGFGGYGGIPTADHFGVTWLFIGARVVVR
jgi:hypothetical protein